MPPAAAGVPVVRETARAKVNLTLHVLGRRPDGRHDLDSLVAFAETHDEVTVAPADAPSLSVAGPFAAALATVSEGDDLALRAARALAPGTDAFAVMLCKNLPVAAGLGGGSADAAAVLRAVGRIRRLPASRLAAAAPTLGSDVPACVESRPLRMGGAGERLVPAAPLPAAPVLLVVPPVALSTARVFAAWRGPGGESGPPVPPCSTVGQLAAALRAYRNDLLEPARHLVPVVGEVLTAIESQAGCLLARMSGSGPSCFGIFPDCAARDAAAARIGEAHPGWWVSATLLRGTSPSPVGAA